VLFFSSLEVPKLVVHQLAIAIANWRRRHPTAITFIDIFDELGLARDSLRLPEP
jgi:hypothetical protein